MSTPCHMDASCMNGEFQLGKLAKCALCRLSPDNKGRQMSHYWVAAKPDVGPKPKHPDLQAEHRNAKFQKRIEKLQAKRSRDGKKRHLLHRSDLAEKRTEKQIIHATKNSGRRNKDGDHVHLGMVTLDTKLQSTRENPIINLAELEKVRADAQRAGKLIGGLVIRNKHGVGCVVLKEEDYARITSFIQCPNGTPNEMGSEILRDGQAGIILVEGS